MAADDGSQHEFEVGYLPGRPGGAAERAARVMARTLGWDALREREELHRYRAPLHPRDDG